MNLPVQRKSKPPTNHGFGPRTLLLSAMLLWLVVVPATGIAGGPQNVLLVVNEDSPESMAVANHYQKLRNIPACNVVYVRNLTVFKKDDGESINSKYFEPEILKPIRKTIEDRHLASQIDCIVYSAGFPTRVVCQPEEEKYLAVTGKKYDIHFHAPYISLNSVTFFQFDCFTDDPHFLDSHSNWYAQPGLSASRPFAAQRYYRQDGTTTDDPASGRRYMLSTVLAVVRPGASTLPQAIEQLQRAASADGTRPTGQFYFADHKDPRSQTRHNQFEPAAKSLRELGYEAIVGDEPMPRNATVLGATLGSAKLNWASSKSSFAPGAFCDNFTSYGGWWAKTQTTLTHFLNSGAAASTGTVYEPYTIASKIPTAFTHVHYARGCTLAESIYQTVLSPYQLLIVGDPLCRPFAALPTFDVAGLTDRSVVQGDLEFIPRASGGEPKIDTFEIYLDGIRQTECRSNQPIQIAAADLTPGYHEVRVVAIDASPARITATRVIDFYVRREQQPRIELKLKIDTEEVKQNDDLLVSCQFPDGQQVRLMHNGRKLGSFDQPGQTLTIPAGRLGGGPSRLIAETMADGQLIRSVPQDVVVTSETP